MSSFLYDTAIPGAAKYAGDNLTAKQAYENALARINQQRQNTLRQYGYEGNIDPKTGVLGGMHVSASNPYGLYQQMLRQGAGDMYQARDDALGRGIKGGLAAKLMTQQRYNFGANSANLGQGLSTALFQYQDQQDQAKYQYDQALYQAQLAAAQNAISNQEYSPADYSGLPYPDYGAPPTPLPTGMSSTAAHVSKVANQIIRKKAPKPPRSGGGAAVFRTQ